MTNNLNIDSIDIDYHINNLNVFFLSNYIHFKKNSKFTFNIFKKSDFKKENYFLNFPAFYFLKEKILKQRYNFFIEWNGRAEDYKMREFKSNIVKDIKYVIVQNKSYNSILNNFKHFDVNEITECFNTDESIISFFEKFNNINFESELKKNTFLEYIVSNIIFHKEHLFQVCFTNFDFSFLDKKFLNCMIDYMDKNNQLHSFSQNAKLNDSLKSKIENIICKKEIKNF